MAEEQALKLCPFKSGLDRRIICMGEDCTLWMPSGGCAFAHIAAALADIAGRGRGA